MSGYVHMMPSGYFTSLMAGQSPADMSHPNASRSGSVLRRPTGRLALGCEALLQLVLLGRGLLSRSRA
jgi:hypothetical protein